MRVVTNGEFESPVHSYGLDCRPIAFGVEQALQEEATRSAIEGGSVLASIAKLAELARRSARLVAEVGMEACTDADLILSGFAGFLIGYSLSEKLGIPLVRAYNVPLTPTGEFPGALVPAAPFLPARIANRLSHIVTRQVVWQAARMAGAKARHEVLGLRPAPFFGPFRADRLAGDPVLCGWSSHVIPKPSDWNDGTHVTGYWYLDEPSGWTPPPGLEAFLRGGPRPIYVGFGSMSHRDPAATMSLVLEAIRLSGQRAVVSLRLGRPPRRRPSRGRLPYGSGPARLAVPSNGRGGPPRRRRDDCRGFSCWRAFPPGAVPRGSAILG